MSLEVTVAKKDLAHIATRMSGIAEKKSTMPLLSATLLRVEGDRLVASATDLYSSLSMSMPATVGRAGAVAVSAKDLDVRVKNLPDAPIELSLKENTFSLKAKGSARKFTIRAMPADDYPPIPSFDASAPSFKIDITAFSRIVALTSFSVSTDESRAHLSSMLFEWEGDTMRAVSTDGHRLSKAEVKVAHSASLSFLLPIRATQEVQHLCEESHTAREGQAEASEITLVRSGSWAFFVSGNTTFSTKLIDAQFPPYKQVIPASSSKTVRIPRTALADAVRAVSVAADAKTYGVKFMLSNGLLRLASQSPESGDGLDEVSVEYAGPNLTTAFNGHYLLKPLAAVGSAEMALGFGEELDPMVMRPVDEAGIDITYVVMPMRSW